LLELVERAVAVFRRLVVLDQHHGNVVAFLGVGQIEYRLGARLQPHRLIVEHPVGNVIVAFLDQHIGGLPRLGQAGTEPAARRLAGRLQDDVAHLADIGAFICYLLQIALGKTVADEFPLALDGGLHDGRIGGER
jgi:hypothetical protein